MSDRFWPKSVHCDDPIPPASKEYFPVLDHCGNETGACGLRLKSTNVDLGTTLKSSVPIFCQKNTTTPEVNFNETVLNCPAGSTVVRMIMFHRKENSAWVPILSLLCQTDRSSNDVFFVDAHEKTDKVSRDSIFANFGAKCPTHSAKKRGSRCSVEQEGKFCGLKFENKASKRGPKVELLVCNQTDGQMANNNTHAVNSTTTLQPVVDDDDDHDFDGSNSTIDDDDTSATSVTESSKEMSPKPDAVEKNTTNPTTTPITVTTQTAPTSTKTTISTTITTPTTPTTQTTSTTAGKTTPFSTTSLPKKKDAVVTPGPEVTAMPEQAEQHEEGDETETGHLHHGEVRLWNIAAVTSVLSFIVGTAFAVLIVRWIRKRQRGEAEADRVQFQSNRREVNEENMVLIHDIHLDD